jgi:hypothetical protein
MDLSSVKRDQIFICVKLEKVFVAQDIWSLSMLDRSMVNMDLG